MVDKLLEEGVSWETMELRRSFALAMVEDIVILSVTRVAKWKCSEGLVLDGGERER